MISYETLDGLSADFARILLARFPEWERYAEQLHYPEYDRDSLQIRVPQPNGERFLELTTENEITVQFDTWHVHCSAFSDVENSAKQAVDHAIELIEDIVSERIVFERKKGGRFASHLKASDLCAPESPFTTQIFSWLGTYDRI